MAHKNDKIITIFRNPGFLAGAQTPEVQSYLATGNESIGAYFESKESAVVGSGLSIDEKRYLLPDLLGVSQEDRAFIEKCNEYYSGLSTKVPYDHGKTFNIGLTIDNNKPLFETDDKGKMTFKQMPIVLADYIRYRHAIGHPFVAMSREAAEGNQLKNFYIFDPEHAEKLGLKTQDSKDEAMALYLAVNKDPRKTDMMLTLLGKDPRDIGTPRQRKDELKRLSEADSDKFLKIHEDKNFENRYWIETLILGNVWTRFGVGGRIINKEDSKLIGNTVEEALAWMQDKDNQAILEVFKSKAQEAMKAIRKQPSKIVR